MAVLSTSSAYLLPPSLQDLHNKTLEWESMVELWKRELVFFKKLLGRYGKELNFRQDIAEKEHFNFLLTYYSGDLMNSLVNQIHTHEARLKSLVETKSRQDEKNYRAEHNAIEHEIGVIQNEFQCYKNELYTLLERVMANKTKNN